jgi:hypothetical protein
MFLLDFIKITPIPAFPASWRGKMIAWPPALRDGEGWFTCDECNKKNGAAKRHFLK